MKNKFFAYLFLSFFFISCSGNKFESNQSIQSPSPAPAVIKKAPEPSLDLKSLPFIEALNVKFESADLSCTLMVYLGKTTNSVKVFETKHFSFNLKELTIKDQIFTLDHALFYFTEDYKASFHQFKSALKVTKAEFGDFVIKDTLSNEALYLRDSPYLSVQLSTKTLTMPPSHHPDFANDIIYLSNDPKISIYENKSIFLYNDQLDLNFDIETQDQIECLLSTKKYPHFSDL